MSKPINQDTQIHSQTSQIRFLVNSRNFSINIHSYIFIFMLILFTLTTLSTKTYKNKNRNVNKSINKSRYIDTQSSKKGLVFLVNSISFSIQKYLYIFIFNINFTHHQPKIPRSNTQNPNFLTLRNYPQEPPPGTTPTNNFLTLRSYTQEPLTQ